MQASLFHIVGAAQRDQRNVSRKKKIGIVMSSESAFLTKTKLFRNVMVWWRYSKRCR